jgi:hypothetical protein
MQGRDFSSARRIPQARGCVFRRGDDVRSVWAGRGAEQPALVPLQRQDRRSACRVPDLGGGIRRRCQDARAVAAEHRALNLAAVAAERDKLVAAVSVPDLRVRVRASRDNSPSVRTERGAPNAFVVTMQHGRQLVTTDGIPHARGPIKRRRYDSLSVRTASHMRAVRSFDAVTILVPSGLKAALRTRS